MTVLRNLRFVEGSGRRYMESVAVSLQPYGFWTLTTVNWALAGGDNAMRIRPLLSNRL
jgi:hypothetical protein